MRLPSDHQDLWFRRKDPIERLKKMFANPDLRGHIKLRAGMQFNNAGDRCITDPSSADEMITLQVLHAFATLNRKSAISLPR